MKTKIFRKIMYGTLVVLGMSNAGFSQGKLEKAKEYADNYQYSKALEVYNQRYKNSAPKKAEVIKNIAHCYLMMNDINTAQMWLSKINTFNIYSPNEVFDFAQALKSTGDYDNAIAQFKRFADLFPDRAANLNIWLKSCEDAKSWIKNPKKYSVFNVEDINTEKSEFGLIPYANGYLFSSDRVLENTVYNEKEIFGWTGNPYLKLFKISQLEGPKVNGEPELNIGVNSKFHNGPGSFDFSTKRVYFTLTKMQRVKPLPVNADPTAFEMDDPEAFVNRLEIYSARLNGEIWDDVKPFEFNNSIEYSVGHPALSADGSIMYFVSNMPGGYGNSDIYYSQKLSDGSWSVPMNAGSDINTPDKEAFPVLDSDGILYFSSDGHPGMGGLDIFVSRGSKTNWTTPRNLQSPINSPKDDFSPYIIEPGFKGYLSSNRDGGKGADDIYYFSKDLVIAGVTKSRILNNTVEILDDVDISIENIVDDIKSETQSVNGGKFDFQADYKKAYEIKASKEGYFASKLIVETDLSAEKDTLFVELILDKIEVSKSFVLENIYYDFDKWNIRPDAATELDKLVTILKEYPEIDVELGSHTDSRGSDAYNEKLSQRRAESAVAYIVSMGISQNRITAKGYGESKLRNKCDDGNTCTDIEHQLNRRTEFTVTKVRAKTLSMRN